MQQVTLTVDGRSYALAQNTDVNRLRTTAEEAVAAGGRFVDVTIAGNTAIAVLISPGVPVLLTIRTVPDDARDTGDLHDPYTAIVWDPDLP